MKVIVLMSGGMDSSVLATNLLEEGNDVIGLMLNYGQRHRKEIESANRMIGYLQNRFGQSETSQMMRIEPYLLDLGAIKPIFEGSALTSETEVPEGHYASENMKITVVNNRNMVFLSLAVALAFRTGSQAVAFGAHKGDHDIYPDCRTDFITAMNLATKEASEEKIEILAPFHDLNKYEIAALGVSMDVPFEMTWSCYKGGEIHCGRCATCVERLEAFDLIGSFDKTKYEDSEFWKKAVKK